MWPNFGQNHHDPRSRKHVRVRRQEIPSALDQTAEQTRQNVPTMVTLSYVPEFAVTSRGEARLTLNLRVSAPELAVDDESARSCVSLSAVIDKSGSMAGSKLELVKRTCQFVLAQLGPKDKLGLVEYDSEVNELVPLSKTSELFRQEAAQIISSMKDGSCTNLSGGLFQGVKQQQDNTYLNWDDLAASNVLDDPASWVMVDDASSVSSASSLANHLGRANLDEATALSNPLKRMRHRNVPKGSKSRRMFGGVAPPASIPVEKDAVRSVFLFTDGMANVGLCDEALVAATKKLLDFEIPIRLFTFGFGADHSERLLSELAVSGGGQYYFLEKEEHIAAAFADALGGLLSVAAQNVTLDLTLSEGVEIEQLHTPFKCTETAAGGRTITLGDLLSEESKDLLMEVRLPSLACDGDIDPAQFELGTLKASWFDVTTSSLQSCEMVVTVERSERLPEGMEPNLQISLQRARVETVEALAEGSRLADESNFEGAREVLELCLKRLVSLVSTAQLKGDSIVSAIAQVLVADLEEAIEGTRDVDVYRTRGSKAMRMKGACRSAQKCDFTSPSSLLPEDEDEEVTRFKSGSARQRQSKALSPSYP